MMTGINIHEEKPYISKLDPDKANPSTYKIGVLSPALSAAIDDQVAVYEGSSQNPNDPVKVNINNNRRNLLIVKFGLRGIENFADPQTNKSVSFDTTSVSIQGKNYPSVSDSIMDMLSKELIAELAEVITNANKLSEAERKN